MRLLGIDWGQAKMGLAIAEAGLAVPLAVVAADRILQKVEQVVEVEQIDGVVVGVSKGKSAKKAMVLAKKLEKRLGLPVVLADETLTTQEANRKAREAHIPRKKRRAMEDAYAAALMLQFYIDSTA